MRNVGGSAPRQGPPCPRADDCIEQVSPATGEKSMAPCKKKPTYLYLTSSSCGNVLECGKVKVACKFK